MTGAAVAGPAPQPGVLDRVLKLFTDVQAGESVTALLLSLNVFLILTSYLILKVLREPLILVSGGAEAAAYSSAGQAVLLLGMVPLYGAIANRVPRRTLINVVTGFFIACLAGFFVLARAEAPFVGVAFFVWLGIFNVMLVAQFWSFANDVYTEDEGTRLFPLVQFGASAGAVFGGWIAGRLIEWTGLYFVMLIAAAALGGATAITNLVDRRERRRTESDQPDALSTGTMPAASAVYRTQTGEFKAVTAEYTRESGTFGKLSREQIEASADEAADEAGAPEPEARRGSFRLLFQSRYLVLIALLVLLLNWVNTTGEFILRSVVTERAAEIVAADPSGQTQGEYIGQFYSDFLTGVNVLGLVVQLFLVSRILKYFGVRVALLILPVIALGGYAFLAFAPVLALSAVRWVKTAENATDYSIQSTVRNVLFLPTSRDEKYKAKQAIDSFFWRAGDVLSAALVFVGTTLAFRTRTFALVNLALVAAWLVIAVLVGRRYHRLAAATAG